MATTKTIVRPLNGFKVFRRRNGELFSMGSGLSDYDLVIKYELGKTIRPKVGRLFGFAHLFQAQDMLSATQPQNPSELEIWQIRGWSPKRIPAAPPVWGGRIAFNFIDKFWGEFEQIKADDDLATELYSRCPNLGSICRDVIGFKSIQLVKKI